MVFDPLIANPGRLRILTALAAEQRQDFVHLRRTTCLTDGNLASHARRLQTAGLIDVEKTHRDGKPVTSFILTDEGRQRLADHVKALMSVLQVSPQPAVAAAVVAEPAEEWVD